MPTVNAGGRGAGSVVTALDGALGRALSPLAELMPRRLRRIADRIERGRSGPIGQTAAVGFLLSAVLYGMIAGGQVGRLADALMVFAGFGIEDVRIEGNSETSEITILERLELDGSLVSFDVAAAQTRIAELPWIERAVVRKFYPDRLEIEIEERIPFALWQRDGEVFVIDQTGTKIVPLDEHRFAKLPFMVGQAANAKAAQFFIEILSEPEIAEQMRAAVYVAGRRWDLHLENGVTVKLPERDVREALAQLVKLNSERQLLARDVVVVDLRLPDRITVRLPEGRSLDEVPSPAADIAKSKKART